MSFKTALETVNKQNQGVEIEIGNESFYWKLTGLSLELARSKDENPFDLFSQMNDNEVQTLELESLYTFLWIGLAPNESDITLSDVKELPMKVIQDLPMEKMMESIVSDKKKMEKKLEK